MTTPTDTERLEWMANHLQTLFFTLDGGAKINWVNDIGQEEVTFARPDAINPSDADILRNVVDTAMRKYL